jgi:hypothetical protein
MMIKSNVPWTAENTSLTAKAAHTPLRAAFARAAATASGFRSTPTTSSATCAARIALTPGSGAHIEHAVIRAYFCQHSAAEQIGGRRRREDSGWNDQVQAQVGQPLLTRLSHRSVGPLVPARQLVRRQVRSRARL